MTERPTSESSYLIQSIRFHYVSSTDSHLRWRAGRAQHKSVRSETRNAHAPKMDASSVWMDSLVPPKSQRGHRASRRILSEALAFSERACWKSLSKRRVQPRDVLVLSTSKRRSNSLCLPPAHNSVPHRW